MARASLVDLLVRALPDFPPETRRFLLAVKRDAFNGRDLGRHSGHPEWPSLDRFTGGQAEAILRLEAEARQLDAEFFSCYGRELDRERHHLFGHIDDTRFLRGVALSSPELVERARVLRHRSASRFDRRERKVEQSLLRFVTRAAAKLSPSSTLTTFALGGVGEAVGPGKTGVLEAALSDVSLVRVSRHVFEGCQALLLWHPRVRERCSLALNDTLEEIEPGRYRFLRPGRWQLQGELPVFRYVPPAQVKVTLTSTLTDSLRHLLASAPVPYASVLEELAGRRSAPAGEETLSRIRHLVDIGFLHLLPPWPTCDPHLEEAWLSFLRSLSPVEGLEKVTEALANLVNLEASYASAERPEHAVRSIEAAIDGLTAAIEQALGEAPRGVRWDPPVLNEDVLLSRPDVHAEPLEALRISRQEVASILGCAELVSRFASLYNHRHDFLHTLAAFWADRWPSRREMALLELFREAQALWQEYLRFDFRHRFNSRSSFNPLGLGSIDGLDRLREQVFGRAQHLMREGAAGRYLAPEGLAALLDTIPERYGPLLGCSVFVQPAEPAGGTWVLNRLFEGTGRYLSRYSAALPELARHRYCEYMRERSAIALDGEEVELLDLMFNSQSTSNVHLPQTRRILQSPGESFGPAERGKVPLRDLRVQVDLSREAFRLVDPWGRRLLPVHLSSLNHRFLPVLLRFLSVFGPYEVRQVFPRAEPVAPGVFERLTSGSLVLQRKRWELDVTALAKGLGENGPEAFRQIHRFRRSAGLPRQVFVFEPIRQGDGSVVGFKPQYLDFGSPSLGGVFLAILQKARNRLICEEALPLFTAFPLDSAGRPRAIELQIDSLALRTVPEAERGVWPLRTDVAQPEGPWSPSPRPLQ